MLNSSLIPETSYEIRLIQSFVSNCLQRTSPVTKLVTNSEKIYYFLLSANFLELQLIASSKTTAFEGNEVVLECNLNTGGALPLSVTWRYT